MKRYNMIKLPGTCALCLRRVGDLIDVGVHPAYEHQNFVSWKFL